MASQAELERLIGKVLMDPEFRQEFGGDCAAAAGKLGISLTDEQKKSFSKAEFSKLSGDLEKMMSKGSLGFGVPA
jgi:hypothetical protein